MRHAEASFPMEGGAVREPALSNAVLAVFVFILTEMMFFVGLISAYMVSKTGAEAWPPVGQPLLPVGATLFNTAVLIGSAVAMYFAGRAFDREGLGRRSEKLLLVTIGMGLFFVVFQGFEWARILNFGLTMRSSTYGAFFYLIIGAHAIHVIGGLFGLIRLFFKMKAGRLQVGSYRGGQLFWYFVVIVWPLLYVVVYHN